MNNEQNEMALCPLSLTTKSIKSTPNNYNHSLQAMLKKTIFDSHSRVELLEQGRSHLEQDAPAPFVRRITLRRPEVGNALSNETRAALFEQLQLNDQDPDVRVTILRGAGPSFCVGYDIADKKTALPSFTSDVDGQQQRNQLEGWFMINDLAKPVIASVHGECLGGGMELAAACDIVLVSTDAAIGYPPVRGQGLPDYQIYPWLMGHRNAMEVMLTNRQMSGEEAVERGFATACFEPSELEAKTMEFATRVAKIPADLLSFNKRSVHRAFEAMGLRTNLRNGVDLETLMFKAPGAKVLTSRRVTKPGEARAPPPRPNSSLPPTPQREAPKIAPQLMVAVNGPAVGASMVSAEASVSASSVPTQSAKESSSESAASAKQASAAPKAVPRPSQQQSAATTEAPTAPKAAVGPKKVASAPKTSEDSVETVSTSEKPTPSKVPASAPKTPAKSTPQASASAKPIESASKAPAVATPKQSAAATPKQPAAATPKQSATATPKATAASATPKPSTPQSPASAATPSKTPATPKSVTAEPKKTAAAIQKAPISVSKPSKSEVEEDDTVHIHIHDTVNIHIHNSKL